MMVFNVADNQIAKDAVAHAIKHFLTFSLTSASGTASIYFATKTFDELNSLKKDRENYVLINKKYNIQIPYWLLYWFGTSSSLYWTFLFASEL